MTDPILRLNAALDGRYRIERELGAGGMATVYLADDLRHERKVAIKVLKRELAAMIGADRFLTEIRTTANLQHPHILPLFDSGEADGFLYYVMPFVEGESLRERLDREKQLPVEEAVGLVTKMATALQAAHDQGVIHRDIKPANILLAKGEPLVADFGIALAVSSSGGAKLTETGMSMGTPQYMSPEQATGDRQIGPSADVYALGSVLYEMLVGEPPFSGGSVAVILGKILSGSYEPARTTRPSVPRNVDAAICKALEGLPADRFQEPRGFVAALEDPSFTHGTEPQPSRATSTPRWKWFAISMTAIAAAMAGLAFWPQAEPDTRRSTRTPVALSDAETPRGIMEVSADGMVVVYEAQGADGDPLLVWRREGLAVTPLAGTEGAAGPAISPDGGQVAFLKDGSIHVMPTRGGDSRTVHSSPGVCCLRWDLEGAALYFTQPTGDLSRVAADGSGRVEVIVPVDDGPGKANGWLAVLPGGEQAVYQASDFLDFDSRIMALHLGSGETRQLASGRFPRYADGFVLYAAQGGDALMAIQLNDALEPTGAEFQIAGDVSFGGGPDPVRLHPVPFAVAANGVLLYTAGRTPVNRSPAWVARDGLYAMVDPTWSGPLSGLSLSPDGEEAASYQDGVGILVKELDGGPVTMIAPEGAAHVYRPSWTPSGDSVVFTAIMNGESTVSFRAFIAPADGRGAPTPLDIRQPHVILSPDNEWFVYRVSQFEVGRGDIFAVPRDLRSDPVPVAATSSIEVQPTLSRDGRFLAYTSNESGSYQVYVRPFPGAGEWRRQVSTAGGHSPVWAHNGFELFYRTALDELAVAVVDTSSGFSVQSREILFDARGFGTEDITATHYDVSLDDRRFLMLRKLDEGRLRGPRRLVIADNLAGIIAQLRASSP